MEWAIWGVLLFLQNAAHTATSRSRNSKSLWYTGIASIFSNGIWFVSQFFIVSMMVRAKEESWQFFALVLVFYIALTAAGSVMSHCYLMKFENRHSIDKG